MVIQHSLEMGREGDLYMVFEYLAIGVSGTGYLVKSRGTDRSPG